MTDPSDEQHRIPSRGIMSRVAALRRPYVVRLISVTLFFAAWETASRIADSPVVLPSPLNTLSALFRLLQTSRLWEGLWETMQAILLGLGLAIVVGIVVGVLMGHFETVEWALDQYVNVFYSMPRVALIPVIIIWLGLGQPARVAVIFLLSVFPILINTWYGIKDLDPQYRELGESYVASRRDLLLDIAIPSAMPFIVSGIRLGVGRAISAAVVAELLLASVGLGGLLMEKSNVLATSDVYALAIVFAVIGVAMTESAKRFERWFLRGKVSNNE